MTVWTNREKISKGSDVFRVLNNSQVLAAGQCGLIGLYQAKEIS